MNYTDHCTEQNVPIPKEPLIFNKFSSAITDPGAPIIYSEETQVTNLRAALEISKVFGNQFLIQTVSLIHG